MIRTRVGYSGGTKADPTYRSLGDHTETIQIDFDPTKITYEQILDIFWSSHDPAAWSWSKQYKNVIFYHNDMQRRTAEAAQNRIAAQTGKKVRTDVEPASLFYPAEDYHQKFRLQQDSLLSAEYDAIYTDIKDFVDSTAVSRVNGYLGGYGTSTRLRREISSFGLSEAGQKRLIDIVAGSGR